jgi:hypothetical protein
MIPQFRSRHFAHFDVESVNAGVFYVVIGLSKKVLIADNLSVVPNLIFAAADRGNPITAFESWAGALAYAMQLFFDFSGYADMAIGLGLLLGVRPPQNFNRPYRAISVRDFWRRWHITLSRFLRHYLYIPGATPPEGWRWALGRHAAFPGHSGVSFDGATYVRRRLWVTEMPTLLVAVALASFLPRTEVLADSLPGLRQRVAVGPSSLGWRAAALGMVFVVSIICSSYSPTFIYFRLRAA